MTMDYVEWVVSAHAENLLHRLQLLTDDNGE